MKVKQKKTQINAVSVGYFIRAGTYRNFGFKMPYPENSDFEFLWLEEKCFLQLYFYNIFCYAFRLYNKEEAPNIS